MADKSVIPLKTDYKDVYDETNYFIKAIVSDFGFYSSFIDSIKAGNAQFDVKRRMLNRQIDNEWVEIIENSIIALDNAIRSPMKDIVEREEVMPIELSHNITSRSLRHLAQHTDYINRIDDDGMIIPSKVLNVFHDETMLTYENKFINTLIQRLYSFVSKRYNQLNGNGTDESNVVMNFSSDFNMGATHGKIRFDLEVADTGKGSKMSMNKRVEQIYAVVTQYVESPFAKSMGQNIIYPPIMRTNAITKNKDLRQCLALWEFIESYDKIGYTISVEESAEKPNEEYINNLYSLLSLQYMMFKYNLEQDFNIPNEVLDSKKTPRPIAPGFKSKIKEIEADDYNVYDAEYRRVIPVSQLSSRHKRSKSEMRVRDAIDVALAADKAIVAQQKAYAKEQKAKAAAEEKLRRAAEKAAKVRK